MTLFNAPQSISYARVTGLFYLIIAVVGFFSILYVPSIVYVPGDPLATMQAIQSNRGLFNLGVIGEVVVILAELMATTMLYFMFKPVSATLSLTAAFARLTMAIVMAVMLFFTAIALELGSGAAFLDVFTKEQTDALALMFLNAHDFGVVIWQLFFTLHLSVLGYLVLKSNAFPKILGILMMLGSFGYLLDSASKFLFQGVVLLDILVIGLLIVVTLGEVSFALYLLIKGGRTAA